ncbi:MAG: hypothetical protein DRJ65_06040 [Acidobacteria bacterium]|nr:MAG: hypothetical protein DRJ65_06040 [Acidobacteriota bacterium]
MPVRNKPSLFTVLVAMGVGIGAYASVSQGVPGPNSPYSLAIVIPGMMIWSLFEGSTWELIGFVLSFCAPIALLTFVWLRPLRHDDVIVPLRSWFVLFALLVFVPLYFATSWQTGVLHQGLGGTLALAAEATTFLLAICILGHRAHRRPSFLLSLAFQGVLFLFIALCAFPWLGEGI